MSFDSTKRTATAAALLICLLACADRAIAQGTSGSSDPQRVATSDTSDGRSVPFYLIPSLGGHNTLRGYTNYRFHDRNLLVFNAESRFLLFDHVDAAIFADAGNVAARVRDLNVAKTSYGVGFRVHSQSTTFARLDIGHSVEGWHIVFKLNDVLDFSRLSRRIVTVPFVP